MIIVYNKFIPFKGFIAMCVWPFIFVRGNSVRKNVLIHENIHAQQQMEMIPLTIFLAFSMFDSGCGWFSLLALPLYYYVYALLWLLRVKTEDPYTNNPMEQEAYANEFDEKYIKSRKPFAWVKYM